MKSLVFAIGAIACCMAAALAQIPPATTQGPSAQIQRSIEPRKLDLDSDGFVSREEAKGAPGLDRRFGRIDTNKDGLLDQDELKQARERREARREENRRSRGEDGGKYGGKQDGEHGRRGERGFAGLDANKDGFLTDIEIKGRPRLQKRFHEIDGNHDNLLSREELRAARRKL